MSETEAAVGIVTETWMRDREIGEIAERLDSMSGLYFAAKGRGEAASNGVTYGGVGLVWSESRCSFKKLSYETDYEVMVCAGKVRGHMRLSLIHI